MAISLPRFTPAPVPPGDRHSPLVPVRERDRAGDEATSWRSYSALRRGTGVAVFYILLTIIFTWPLAGGLGERHAAHIDPPFSAWRLARLAHQLVHDPANLFEGNVFWPARRTLAYSDAMLLPGVLAVPLLEAGMGSLAVMNLFTLIGIATSAFGAYVLARRLTGHTGAAILAGLIFAFAPYRRAHLPHLELQWAQWMPLAFWAWHRALDGGRFRDGLLCGLFVLAQLFSSIYYGIFLGMLLGVVGGLTLLARRGRIGRRALSGLVLGAAIVAASAAVYSRPYRAVQGRLGERTAQETARYSAVPASYVTATADNLLYGWTVEEERVEEERMLFPGVAPVVLAGAALVPPAGMVPVVYVAGTLVAGEMSLGMHARLFPLLREHVSVFRGLRAPARFGVLVQLLLGVLAALGLARIARRYPRQATLIVVGSIGVVMAEYATQPLRVQTVPAEPPPIYRWLASQPPEITLELPVPESDGLPFHDPFYMYASTWHWQPLVNGYSGHYADHYIGAVDALRRLPSRRALEALDRLGVTRIVIHGSLFPEDEYDRLVEALEEHPLFHLLELSSDHVGEVRAYAYLPAFGPEER